MAKKTITITVEYNDVAGPVPTDEDLRENVWKAVDNFGLLNDLDKACYVKSWDVEVKDA